MKTKSSSLLLLILLVSAIFMFNSCSSYEFTGQWDDNDMDYVSKSLVSEMLNSEGFKRYTKSLGRIPVIRIGTIRTNDETDVTVLASKLNNQIFASGVADVVLDRRYTRDLHYEQAYQTDFSYESDVSMGNELGVDLLLQGSVKVIQQETMLKSELNYHVSLQLTDTITGRLIWTGENSQITREIQDMEAQSAFANNMMRAIDNIFASF